MAPHLTPAELDFVFRFGVAGHVASRGAFSFVPQAQSPWGLQAPTLKRLRGALHEAHQFHNRWVFVGTVGTV